MLAKRLDPVETYKRRSYTPSPVYSNSLKRRKLSVHARFVSSAFDVFPGATILENIPAESANGHGQEQK
ncbi:MAG: hypothetical protein KC800_05125 [Candidatus Eremiobacteraeota bacterium]|nr:hypothetical protein [Candidatus Eremiobacteraeota bacterium]